jgi:predicted nucleotidyltransferase
MINPLFQNHIPAVTQLMKQYRVKNAFVFGSVVTNRFNEESDVDFLINFEENLDPLEKGELMWNLRYALQDILHREIDLLTESSLKNPYFIEELNEKKILIYG